MSGAGGGPGGGAGGGAGAGSDGVAVRARDRDRVDDRRTTMLTFGVVLTIFAVGVSVPSVFVLGILPRSMLGDAAPAEVTLNLIVRLAANAGAVVAGLAGVLLLAPQERRAGGRVLTGAVLALAAALARASLQVALGIYRPSDVTEVSAEIATAFVATAISLVIALVQTDARRRLRTQERDTAAQALRASAALEALQGEELRIRREVADGLHGTVQQRFILLGARLDALLPALAQAAPAGPTAGTPGAAGASGASGACSAAGMSRAGGATDARDAGDPAGTGDTRDTAGSGNTAGAGDAAVAGGAAGAGAGDPADELRAIRAELDALREQDLRAMSELLYPARLDQGAVPAVRALLARVPATIAVRFEVSPAAAKREGGGARTLPPERRLLLVRIVEEALSNALKHGRATEVALTLDHVPAAPPPASSAARAGAPHTTHAGASGAARAGAPPAGIAGASGAFVVVFDDDGAGLPAEGEPPSLNGLARLRGQLDLAGGTLDLAPSPLGGARLRAILPA